MVETNGFTAAQLESELFNREMKEKTAILHEKLNIDSGSAGEPMVNQEAHFTDCKEYRMASTVRSVVMSQISSTVRL